MDATASPRRANLLFQGLLAAVAVVLLLALYWTFALAPGIKGMGLISKIFYFHVPAAFSMYLGFIVCGVASFFFLLRRTSRWDALAMAGAQVGLVCGGMVLLTGPLWARGTWGRWWVWQDPQLTTTLIIVLIYAAYLFLRRFLGEQPGSRRLPAVLAIIGLLDIPLIHYSVRLWRGQHPEVMRGNEGGVREPEMIIALLLALLALLLLTGLLIWLRQRVELLVRRVDELRLDLLEQQEERKSKAGRSPLATGASILFAGLLLVLLGTALPAALAQTPTSVPPTGSTTNTATPACGSGAPGAPTGEQPARTPGKTPPSGTAAPSTVGSGPVGPSTAGTPVGAAPLTQPLPGPAAGSAPVTLQPVVLPLARPQETSVRGATLLIGAYALIWLLTLLFLGYLWRKQVGLEQQLRELDQQIRGGSDS